MLDAPKQRINVTISSTLLEEAKAMGMNLSQAAEAGILLDLKRKKEGEWRKENAAGIAAHNERIEKHGPLITPIWEDR